MQSVFTYRSSRGIDWTLHSKIVTLRNKHEQRIFWFAKQENSDFSTAMPDGYEVMETSRTGMPVLKKIK